MKGVVFTLLLDMVDDTFGPAVTEQIISASDLPSGGVYTAVGTYDHAEIVALVTNLSKETELSVSALVHTFGKHPSSLGRNVGYSAPTTAPLLRGLMSLTAHVLS